MSDYYPQFLSSMSGIVPNYPPVPHGHPAQAQMGQLPQQGLQMQAPLPQQMPLQHPLQETPQQTLHQHHLQQQLSSQAQPPLSLPPHLHHQPAMDMGMGMTPPGLVPASVTAAMPGQVHGQVHGPAPGQYPNMSFFPGFPEVTMFNAPKAQRHRRKSAPGPDHIKHRRTRSGCFTCRSRRIKCDEMRPTCERCKKGNRECLYPDPPALKGQSSSSSSRDPSMLSQQASPDSSNEDDEDDLEQENAKLDTILDDDEADEAASGAVGGSLIGTPSAMASASYPDRTRPPLRQSSSTSLRNLKRSTTASSTSSLTGAVAASASAGRGVRQASETPSFEGKGSSPATSTGTSGSLPQTVQSAHSTQSTFSIASSSSGSGNTVTAATAADWDHLPNDLRFFLGYFVDNITHYHYCIPTDADYFVRTLLPALAVRYEPLLYALVAFSAYHYMLRDPGANMQQFLLYYDQSVRLLLGVLQRRGRHQPHNLGTLLAVLQLATIEEYLGDWVNLMGHQKAALEMLTDIYTPTSAMQTATGRMVLHWYSRFDVFVGMMGGFRTALARDWFTAPLAYYRAQAAHDLANATQHRIEVCSAELRLISLEMSLLFARAKDDGGNGDDDDDVLGQGGGILSRFPSFAPDEAFVREHARILGMLLAWKHGLDAVVEDSKDGAEQHPLLVTDFSYARSLGDGDIVNPYQPGVLYYEPLFGVTLLTSEWHSIVIMHEMQAAQLAMGGLGGGLEGGGDQASMEGAQQAAATTTAEATAAAAGLAPAGGVLQLPHNMAGSTASLLSAAAAGPAQNPSTASDPIAAAMATMPADLARRLAGLAERAYAICTTFEALERWPASPPGCLIFSQAMLAISTLFLPRDQRHHMWIRRKFALIETMGYIFPITMRSRMAELFNDPSCVHWWLPNNEGFSPILRSVRAFADERNVTAVSAQTENLRQVRHIFAKLQIGEGDGLESSGGGGDTEKTDAADDDRGKGVGASTWKHKKGSSHIKGGRHGR